jgi:hypothetical protein
VGRSAIDEDAIRLLEQYNPDVQFDWTHILKPTPAAPGEPAKERGFDQAQARPQRKKERRGAAREPDVRAAGPKAAPPRVVDEPLPEPAPIPVDEPEEDEEDITAGAEDLGSAPVDEAEEARLAEEALGPDEETMAGPTLDDRRPAAYERLGSEGLARLRARYAEVMARIAERPMEDAAREELKLRAERLNPDGWVTADEVQQALEQYESIFDGLRALVGTRRRRRRRRGQGGSRKTEDGSRKTEE